MVSFILNLACNLSVRLSILLVSLVGLVCVAVMQVKTAFGWVALKFKCRFLDERYEGGVLSYIKTALNFLLSPLVILSNCDVLRS